MNAPAARRLRDALVLALALYVLAFAAYFHLAPPGPALGAVNADPELAYFVSSLAVFKGLPYVFVQHPGTPLEALGTALLALTYPLRRSSPAGFVAASVARPQTFLLMAHALLALASAACVLALGRKAIAVRRASDAVLAAAVPAAFFAFLPRPFTWTFFWSHNAVALPAGAALLLAGWVALRRGRPLRARTAWLLGLAAGVLAATQLYFATWALGLATAAAALARARGASAARAALRVAAGAAAGFVLGVLPMFPARGLFLKWLRDLVFHQGLHGQGAPGTISWPTAAANLGSLWDGAPALFLATLAVFAALVAARVTRPPWRGDAGLWATAAGLTVQWAATVVLFAKHASLSYLPALAAMLPLLLAVAFVLWRRSTTGRRVCLAAATVVLLACAHAAAQEVVAHRRRLAFRVAMDADVARFVADEAAARGSDAESVLLLWGPGLPDAGCYGLWAGNEYSSRALHPEISRVCPSQGLLWSNTTVLPAGWAGADAEAVLVTTDEAPRLFPAFAAFGPPRRLGPRGPSGARVAFHSVRIERGQARPAAR